jgi:hypothetical protein
MKINVNVWPNNIRKKKCDDKACHGYAYEERCVLGHDAVKSNKYLNFYVQSGSNFHGNILFICLFSFR